MFSCYPNNVEEVGKWLVPPLVMSSEGGRGVGVVCGFVGDGDSPSEGGTGGRGRLVALLVMLHLIICQKVKKRGVSNKYKYPCPHEWNELKRKRSFIGSTR